MKIWIYWSESNSLIYFDIVLKKTEKSTGLSSAYHEECYWSNTIKMLVHLYYLGLMIYNKLSGKIPRRICLTNYI